MNTILVLILLAGVQDDEDKKADSAIEQFKKDMKSPEADKRVQAIGDLGKIEHLKVFKVLAPYLTKDDTVVRKKAAETLGEWKTCQAEAGKALLAALSPNAKSASVIAAILQALGNLRDKSALAEIHARLNDASTEVSLAAIAAAEKIRKKESVEPLLKQLEKVDQEESFIKSSETRGQGSPSDDKKKRLTQQRDTVTGALRSLTKQNFVTFADWWNWWQKNKATFKVQD